MCGCMTGQRDKLLSDNLVWILSLWRPFSRSKSPKSNPCLDWAAEEQWLVDPRIHCSWFTWEKGAVWVICPLFLFVFTDDDNGDLLLPNDYLLVSDWEWWIDGILGAFQCKRIATSKRKPLLCHNCQQKWINNLLFSYLLENLMGFYYLTF